MNKRISVSIALAITIIAMTVTFSITWIISMNTFDNTVSAVTRLQSQYAKLAEIDNYVRSNFSGEIDDNTLFDRVALGYVTGLGDKYSVYYTEKEYTELLDVEKGELVGIGIDVVRDADGVFRIVRVHEGSPAALAGLTPGGSISMVDGEDAKTITTVKSLQSRLYGGVGTELSLTCIYNVTEAQEFSIRRSSYTKPVVESRILGDYAYIRIASFAQDPFADFNYVVSQALAAGVKGLVFDVRGNAEGHFRNTYESIDYLCPVGTVAKSVNKTGTTRVLATSDEAAVDVPMVVLVDGGTSGPAELFAVSLRDLAGGQIVGTKTAGHGTMQSTPYRLSDGSAVSVTVAQLLTGRDEDFNGVGFVPNVEVESNMEERFPSIEEYLYNPDTNSDDQIKRALEVARTMVRESGQDPGTYTNAASGAAPAAGGAPAASSPVLNTDEPTGTGAAAQSIPPSAAAASAASR